MGDTLVSLTPWGDPPCFPPPQIPIPTPTPPDRADCVQISHKQMEMKAALEGRVPL